MCCGGRSGGRRGKPIRKFNGYIDSRPVPLLFERRLVYRKSCCTTQQLFCYAVIKLLSKTNPAESQTVGSETGLFWDHGEMSGLPIRGTG